jgi:hypothetical protein
MSATKHYQVYHWHARGYKIRAKGGVIVMSKFIALISPQYFQTHTGILIVDMP